MKRRLAWIRLEEKSMIKKLPKSLLAIAIFVLTTGMAILCAYHILIKNQENGIQIGYVAEDNLTRMAASYFEELSSVSDWCHFISLSEREGLEKLDKGELQALFVMPEGMVESILDGENKAPKLYLSQEVSAFRILFEELGNAGVSMLQTAQAQIYAAYRLGASDLCDRINADNLSLVTGREQLFYAQTLSVTNRQGLKNYYLSAALTLFFLLMPAFLGFCLEKNVMQLQQLHSRLGIPVWQQAFLQMSFATVVLFAGFVLWRGFSLTALLLAGCIGAYSSFMNSLFSTKRYTVLAGSILAVVQGYLVGCFLPEVLLPDNIQTLAGFLPCFVWKEGAIALLCRNELANNAKWDCFLWTCLLLLLQIFVMNGRMALHGKTLKSGKERNRFYHKPVPLILCHRLCRDYRFWLCILVPFVAIQGISSLEKTGKTVIRIGVYDEEGIWKNQLSDTDNYLVYVSYPDEESMKKAVQKGELTCGFTFPEDFSKKLQKKENLTWCIPVYEREDAILTPAVEECVYAVIFRYQSNMHYQELMQDRFQDEQLEAALSSVNSQTFQIEKTAYQSEGVADRMQKRKENFSLLQRLARGVMLLLCIGYGILQAVYDGKRSFYHRKAGWIVLCDISFPLFFCILLQFLLT